MALQYVGGITANGTSSTYDVDLTSLTGGIDTQPAENDIVVVAVGYVGSGSSDANMNISGYTELADLFSNDTYECNFYVGYKIMGASPDTSVTVPGSGSASYGGATIVEVWRGIDTGNPIDVTTQTATGTDSSSADPPSITPVTPGSAILNFYFATGDSTPSSKTITTANLAIKDKIYETGTGTSVSALIGAMSSVWSRLIAFNPTAWSGGETTTSDSWCSASVALRPAVSPPYFVSNGTVATATTGELTVSWGTHQADDIGILVVESQANATGLSTPSGFTQIGSNVSATNTILQAYWCRATSGAMADVVKSADSNHQYGVILVYRGCKTTGDPFTTSANDVKNSASTTTTSPAITTTRDTNLVIAVITNELDATTAFASGQTNDNLYGKQERIDGGTDAGNGGGIAVLDGIMPSAGDTGTTTTTVTSTRSAMLTFNLDREDISSISLSPSLSESLSPSLSPSGSASASESISASLSESASPSTQLENYSKGDYLSLPANDNDLETSYSAQDYIDVNTKDNIRVGQTATNQYTIHQFKDNISSAVSVNVEWEGQTNLACSISPVVLQVYNQNTNLWETIDSDSTTGADTDFTLSANIPDTTNYLNAGVISCRVYQLGV